MRRRRRAKSRRLYPWKLTNQTAGASAPARESGEGDKMNVTPKRKIDAQIAELKELIRDEFDESRRHLDELSKESGYEIDRIKSFNRGELSAYHRVLSLLAGLDA